jgi:hypothetical protein
MKNVFALFLLIAGLLLSAAGIAQAQDYTQAPQSPTATPTDNATAADNNYTPGNAGVQTLSGCLQTGAGANEYTLFGPDANSWEITSNSIDLAAHVDQAVRVAYVPPQQSGSNGTDKPFIVTDLQMVSSSCDW